MRCRQLTQKACTIQCGTPHPRILRIYILPSQNYNGTRTQQDGKYTYGVNEVVAFGAGQYSRKNETMNGKFIVSYQNIN